MTLLVASCADATRGPISACAVMRPLLPIDLTQPGWDALDAADPAGAKRLDDLNEWWDQRCAG
jgi:hypothetical protein